MLSVPAVPADRYYVLQCIDLFTYNFGLRRRPGDGNGAGNYLFAGPRWHGATPSGFTRCSEAETEIVGVLGRTPLTDPGTSRT